MGRVRVRVRVGVGVRVRVTDVRGLEQRLFLHRTEERDGHLSRVGVRVRVRVRDGHLSRLRGGV